MPLLKDILPGLRAKHGNQTEVAKLLGISSQLLGRYEKGKRHPKSGFYKKWKSTFNEDLEAMINEPNVSRGTEKGTPVQKPDDNKENNVKLLVQDFINRNSGDYLFVPKVVLNEDYRIYLKTEIDSKNKYLEKLVAKLEESDASKEAIIQDKNELIADLEEEIEELEKELEKLKKKTPPPAN